MSQRSKQAGLKLKTSSARKRKSLKMKTRTNKSGMLNGRPRIHDRVKFKREIVERVANGELVSHVLKDLGCSNFFLAKLQEEDEEFDVLYARARVLQTRALASKALEIGDGLDRLTKLNRKAIRQAKRELKRTDPKNWRHRIRTFESNLIQRNRLQLDALKWYARVTNPREFGDKVDLTSAGDKIKNPGTLVVKFVGADKSLSEEESE